MPGSVPRTCLAPSRRYLVLQGRAGSSEGAVVASFFSAVQDVVFDTRCDGRGLGDELVGDTELLESAP